MAGAQPEPDPLPTPPPGATRAAARAPWRGAGAETTTRPPGYGRGGVRSVHPDPERPIAHFRERERRLDGSLAPVLTVLLAGAECPFTCVFCDLWRRTLDGPTPPGAIPAPVGDRAPGDPDHCRRVCAAKLYNASNFFDPRAVPPEDDAAIAGLLRPFDRVTVECHPRLVARRCLEFADLVPGQLEVAMGLETADEEALARLNKGMTLDDFDLAAARLARAGIALRAFVLFPAPFVPAARAIESALDAVRHAVDQGAAHVTLIPTRDGNGALDALREQELWSPPARERVEAALEDCARISGAVVTVDLWDIDRVPACPRCGRRADRPAASLQPHGRSGSPRSVSGMHVVIVGAGFAGSILARVARAAGHDVTLVERGAHPRFALGESSTPLAAIALERLASRYGLDDLHRLAAYGRWMAHLPEVRRGLKRGFTFYRHERGRPFHNDRANSARLLVAASPDDHVADAHWLREDVDAFLFRRAAAAGVRCLERTDLETLERRGGRFLLRGARADATHQRRAVRLTADLVVDASGPDGFLARRLELPTSLPPGALHTGLVYGHFRGMKPLRRAAGDAAVFPAGPYPDEQAAVHHLLDDGWLYELAFDHGVVSAGFVVEGTEALRTIADCAPADAFQALVRRYPSLAAQYESAVPVRPPAVVPRLQRRLSRAAGDGWTLLPHVFQFWSPLFSTGIAWSLLGVERLGLLLEDTADAGKNEPGLPAAGLRTVRSPAAVRGGPSAPPHRARLPLPARLRRVRCLWAGVLRGGELQRDAPADASRPARGWRPVGLVGVPRRHRSGAAKNRRGRNATSGRASGRATHRRRAAPDRRRATSPVWPIRPAGASTLPTRRPSWPPRTSSAWRPTRCGRDSRDCVVSRPRRTDGTPERTHSGIRRLRAPHAPCGTRGCVPT